MLENQHNVEYLKENKGLLMNLEENEAKFKDLFIENQRNFDLSREKQENLEFLNRSLDENKANIKNYAQKICEI